MNEEKSCFSRQALASSPRVQDVTTGAVTSRFSASADGQYPVFLLLSGLEDACGSANMVDPPVQRSVTQIGVINIRS